MSEIFNIVEKTILQPADLTPQKLQTVLSSMMGNGIDCADIYFQHSYVESWSLEDGVVKDGSFHVDHGVGIRAMSEAKAGLAYTNQINLENIKKAAQAAKSITRQGKSYSAKLLEAKSAKQLYQANNPIQQTSSADKIAFLMKIDQLARQHPHVEQVIATLAASYDVVLLTDTDGTLAADVRPLVRISISVVIERNGRREKGVTGGGGRFGFEAIMQDGYATNLVEEAIREAMLNLEAVPAPAGMMPVVLGAGWPGVLLHEAVGHGLEGDFNRKGSSAYSGRIGEKVASSLCTVVDDGTVFERRGSLSIDDEGTPSQYNVLIENGILKGYMFDKLNARLMGEKSTGNGRRESYAHLVMPRMTNTYMLPGKHDPAEIIASVKRGLYAVNFGGGQVDITSGKFVFSASEAYLIEDGKVTQPVKGATLIGNGPEVLQYVSMVGHDLKLDPGIGVCGKDGQSVPVGVGQPTLKIDQLTVGGTHE